ncbi:hypothetical protein PHYBOEH_006094 [Phytophthora boehmeriae]|uniref:Uncharacterized protein n=1 Tax=Phytophthora boehmeriae TaxID=109152 RepID=A0A8T1X2L4_9STRA|nr:hypothetical protein PHYBOEH_006094 [Phytophthora boehmeriae]
MTGVVPSPDDDVSLSHFLTTEIDPLSAMLTAEKTREHEYHCRRMMNYRRKKKQEREELLSELRRLQRAMKLQEEIVRNDASTSGQSIDTSIRALLRDVIVEKEALFTQNVVLRKEIQQHETFQTLIQEKCYGEHESQNDKPTLWPSLDQAGWRVRLPYGDQSFHFHPFSREEFDAFPNPFSPGFLAASASYSYAGTFLGWKAYRSPSPPDKPLSVRMRFTKRIQCSVDIAYRNSWAKEAELFPILVTPIGWGYGHHHKVTTQVLQEFDRDARVMFQNIPGQTHYRYLFLSRSAQWELLDGRRKVAFSMLIVDSKATKRAQEHQDDVKWYTNGGNYLTLTEVDETTTDAVYEQWVDCESELHAAYLILQWTHLAIRWEQGIVPSNLLPFHS